MRCESDLHTIVHVAPLRMMVHLFRHHGDLTHEAKCLAEVDKVEGFRDGIRFAEQFPSHVILVVWVSGAEKRVEDGRALLGGQR